MIGTKLGHYEITEKLGEGGMGVVYRATDTKLNRDVAIKLLPDVLAHDRERMERFRREAQLLAQLNHAAIAGIHGIEESSGQFAIVMELAEGPTLAERLDAGPIPMEEAVPLARQIAEALEAAHERGIIHRDLKPANIKISSEGHVKVLDFGLAKALEDDPTGRVESDNSPTLTMAATQAGVILGTAAYMSPELARGRQADKRSDIWSFGVVLYEMLTGRQLFGGETVSDSLAGVLKSEIDWSPLPADTPNAIRRLLRRCLKRSRTRRLQASGDARIELEEALVAEADDVSEKPEGRSRPWQPWGLFAASTLALLALSFVHSQETPSEVPLSKFAFTPDSIRGDAVVSPDGRRIVYASADPAGGLWVRDLDDVEPHPIEGTEGASGFPCWSPDSQTIVFEAGGELKKISIDGRGAITLCEAPGSYQGGAWSPDGKTVIFATIAPTGLYKVSVGGGTPEQIPVQTRAPTGDGYNLPEFLPTRDRRLVLHDVGSSTERQLILRDLDSGEESVLVAGSGGIYSPTGHILYHRSRLDGDLWALPFSIESAMASGEPFLVASGVGYASVSQDSVLVYTDVATQAEQLYWVDRAGEKLDRIGKAQGYVSRPRLSPSGRWVAVRGADSENTDIWLHEVDRPVALRLTIDPMVDSSPVWHPSGQRIAFRRGPQGRRRILTMPIDGSEEPLEMLPESVSPLPWDWSRDGRFLVYTDRRQDQNQDIWCLERRGQGDNWEARSILSTPFQERKPALSPDGRFLAYESDKSGRLEVYVQPFPEGGAEHQVSIEGGGGSRWRGDGRELYYVSRGVLMAVPVEAGDRFSTGTPRPLFSRGEFQESPTRTPYDVSADGQRFVVVGVAEQDDSGKPAVHVVLNWFEEFRDRQ